MTLSIVLAVVYVAALVIMLLVGALVAAHREIRKLRALNDALMAGAARRLMDDVRPHIAAALDRLGPDAAASIDINLRSDQWPLA